MSFVAKTLQNAFAMTKNKNSAKINSFDFRNSQLIGQGLLTKLKGHLAEIRMAESANLAFNTITIEWELCRDTSKNLIGTDLTSWILGILEENPDYTFDNVDALLENANLTNYKNGKLFLTRDSIKRQIESANTSRQCQAANLKYMQDLRDDHGNITESDVRHQILELTEDQVWIETSDIGKYDKIGRYSKSLTNIIGNNKPLREALVKATGKLEEFRINEKNNSYYSSYLSEDIRLISLTLQLRENELGIIDHCLELKCKFLSHIGLTQTNKYIDGGYIF